MTPHTTALDFEGHRIRLRGAMLSLTDLWKAAGRPEKQQPADWLLQEEAARLRTRADEPWDEEADTAPLPPLPEADDLGFIPLSDGTMVVVWGHGGTWAHWQLALSYGRTLSPALHLWCDTVVRAAMQRNDDPSLLPPRPARRRSSAPEIDPTLTYLVDQIRRLDGRLDNLDRHAADMMFLQVSSRELLLGQRRHFSEGSRDIIAAVVAAPPYEGDCPCCCSAPVLDERGNPLPGAEFDHAFHRGLNRPEHGWLVCKACHGELTHGGYLSRFERKIAFSAFQRAVFEHRRRARLRAVPPGPSRGA